METDKIVDVNVVNETTPVETVTAPEVVTPSENLEQVLPLMFTIQNGKEFAQSLENTLIVIESSACLIENASAKRAVFSFIESVLAAVNTGMADVLARQSEEAKTEAVAETPVAETETTNPETI